MRKSEWQRKNFKEGFMVENKQDFVITKGVLTKYNGPGGDVVIPAGVKKIGDGAFKGCVALTGVTIPEGVKEIGGYAFYGCKNLKTLTVPRSVKKIGKYAFSGCDFYMALIAPYFPISNVERDDKLKACRGFARVYLENAVEDGEVKAGYLRYIKSQRKNLYIDAIGDGALLHLLFAARLVQPKDIEDLMGYKAYFRQDTEALIQEYRDRYLGPADPVKEAEQKKKAAGKSAKSMEEFEATGVMTLAEAEKLYTLKREKGSVIITRYKDNTSPDADVVIPRVIGKSPVTGINAGAFSGTPNIRSVTIPEGVKTIGGFAFTGCFNLQSVTLPKSLREMVSSVFMDCKRLESITIPGGLKHIPDQCFSGCSGLTSVTIEKGVKIIGRTAFSGCNIESLTIPEGVTSIETDAFWARSLRYRKVQSPGQQHRNPVRGVCAGRDC
jgi:hypothetical protein